MYKVTKDAKVGALIFDRKEVFNGWLSQASQKQLEGLFELGIKGIEYAEQTEKKRKKTRDNAPDSEAPKLDDADDVQEKQPDNEE